MFPQSSVNYQLRHGGLCGNFIISIGQPIPLDRYTIRAADLLDIPLHNNIAELFVQFDGAADAVSLFTGDQRAARTAEGVQYRSVAHAGVHNGIGQERDGFHGRMIAILLRLVELPDGGLFASGVPLVLAFLFPAIQHRLMLPLIRRSAQYQRLLLPDTAAG